MSQALNEIQELFTKSDANPVDLNDMLVFLPILPEEVLQKLAETFVENPETIKDFIANFKSKFNALAGQQNDSWNDIASEESGGEFDNASNDKELENSEDYF